MLRFLREFIELCGGGGGGVSISGGLFKGNGGGGCIGLYIAGLKCEHQNNKHTIKMYKSLADDMEFKYILLVYKIITHLFIFLTLAWKIVYTKTEGRKAMQQYLGLLHCIIIFCG